jgi:hypothetical protein
MSAAAQTLTPIANPPLPAFVSERLSSPAPSIQSSGWASR